MPTGQKPEANGRNAQLSIGPLGEPLAPPEHQN